MLITEFIIDHPVLGESLERVDDIEITWEETYNSPGDLTQMIFWVRGGSFEAFEDAILDETAVENLKLFTELDDRRLYRVDFSQLGRETNLMGELIEVGAVLQEAVGTADGWRCRVRFPNRTAFQQVYEFCRTHDIDFRLERMYQRVTVDDNDSTLTDAQRETLIAAVETGYLDIPRQCSLEELGDRLGISQSSASERFRRGVKTLVRETL